MPLNQLNLEIIWGCNLKCPMCPGQTYPTKTPNRYLEVDQIQDLLFRLPFVKAVNIIGLGEPLLHPQWNEIVELLFNYDVSLIFTTNATLLTKEKIMNIPPGSLVAISLDTLDPEIYPTIRKGADLNQVIENIRLLRHLKPLIRLTFNTVVMQETVDTLHTLLPLAKDVRAEIRLFYPITFNKEDHQRFYPDKATLKEKIKNFRRLAFNRYRVNCFGGNPTPSIRECVEPLHQLTINIKGEMYACTYIYEARDDDKTPDYFNECYDGHCIKVPQYQYSLGNAFTDNIIEIYERNQINHIRVAAVTSPKPEQNFNTLRQTVDLTLNHEYCRICAHRWGVMC